MEEDKFIIPQQQDVVIYEEDRNKIRGIRSNITMELLDSTAYLDKEVMQLVIEGFTKDSKNG
jgi:hypothetical protein